MAERTQSYYHNYRLHNDLSENCTLLLQDYLIASLERIEKKTRCHPIITVQLHT